MVQEHATCRDGFFFLCSLDGPGGIFLPWLTFQFNAEHNRPGVRVGIHPLSLIGPHGSGCRGAACVDAHSQVEGER